MKFDLKMHPEFCMLKDNNHEACPFIALGGHKCFIWKKKIIINRNIDEYERCPECIAEERKQKESEGKS